MAVPYLTKLIKKLAPKIGAKAIVEPKWGVVAQIIYKNGVVRSLRMYSLDLNHIASADIAKDKGYSKFFMARHGYPVPPGQTFLKDKWARAIGSKDTISKAIHYAKRAGYPLIVKPNSQSQGSGVCLVWNNTELKNALREAFRNDKVALVEKYLMGHDYRIVVLDGEIISAYERIPLSVVGDGKNSVLSLLKQKQKNFIKTGRDTKIDFSDRRMGLKLRKAGYTWKSILPKGLKVFLLDNANLSTGGDAIDVTKKLSSGYKKMASDLTRKMGLRISGVDIIVVKGDITKNPAKDSYYILEINAAPGLDHYVTTGTAQRRIVEGMYFKVLKALGKKDF